jgi:hypothetical protein
MKHTSDVAKFIKDGDYEETVDGLLIHRSIMARGSYVHTVNGQDERTDHNLIPAEGILYLLGAGLGATSKEAAFYLALFSGAVTPAANWTAANFTANASELTSQSEGYSGANRPVWTPGAAAAGKIGNLASRATFNIVATSTINVTGAALLSAQARGATTGVLVSASRYASTRVLNGGDTFELGYEVELTDS